MKKRLLSIAALTLALCMLLTGCGFMDRAAEQFEELTGGLTDSFDEAEAWELCRFSDMPYERPDMSELEEQADAVISAIADGEDVNVLMELLDDCYQFYYDFDTMYSIADIRYCLDTSDEYYAEEYQWCEENYSYMQQLFDEILYACATSPHAEALEQDYFWEGFQSDYDDDSELLSDRAVELMQEESDLLSEYRQLSSNATINVYGKDVDFFEYASELDDEGYYAAQDKYYEENCPKYARIYIDLIKVRRALASELGYDSYEQMQYDYYFERDYTPEQAAQYIADIKEYMVPLYGSATDYGAFDDLYYDYLSERRLYNILEAAAEQMGGDVKDAFEFMSKYELYDTTVSYDKIGMSFQSYLTGYNAPFLFLDAYGDDSDILSFAHEFGHYTDCYVNNNSPETIDLSEFYSQAMEYLVLGCAENELDEESLDNLRRMKLEDTFVTYIQQASFAEFESLVYALPDDELTMENINLLSLQSAIDYGYYDGVSETYYAMSWFDISHFFEQPFYVISYPVSSDAAMQIYFMELESSGRGVQKYKEMLPRDYSELLATLSAAGLESPFEPDRVQKVADMLSKLM